MGEFQDQVEFYREWSCLKLCIMYTVKTYPPEQKKKPKEKETNNTQKKSTVKVCPRAFNSSGSSLGGEGFIFQSKLCRWIVILTNNGFNHLDGHKESAYDRMIMICMDQVRTLVKHEKNHLNCPGLADRHLRSQPRCCPALNYQI